MTLCRRDRGCGAIACGSGAFAAAAGGGCCTSSRGSDAFYSLDIGAPFPEKGTFPSSRRSQARQNSPVTHRLLTRLVLLSPAANWPRFQSGSGLLYAQKLLLTCAFRPGSPALGKALLSQTGSRRTLNPNESPLLSPGALGGPCYGWFAWLVVVLFFFFQSLNICRTKR